MGVPFYFKYWTSKGDGSIKTRIGPAPVILYLDFNSVIYEAKNNVSVRFKEKGATVPDKKLIIEYEILQEVVRLFEKIVNSIGASRLKMVYIAIDGAAPMAKIIQQRQRRFKSAFEAESLRQIAADEGIETSGIQWDSNAITPGTKFMDRLCAHLEGYICQIKGANKSIQFILDSSKNAGEGEHKLFKHMDTHKQEHQEFQKVIYGLDADLIILSLIRGYQQMYLYRETSYFPFKPDEAVDYMFMDVSVLRNIIIDDYWHSGMDTHQRLIVDYVFLTYLLGNDFLPNLFILKIQKGGFELLNQLYLSGFKTIKCHLINKDLKIHSEFFRYILNGLSKKENHILTEMYEDHRRFRPMMNPKLSSYEKRVSLFHYYPTHVAEKDVVRIGSPGWQDRFYKYWLDTEPDQYMIHGMCQNYLEGLSWILHYYMKSCPSLMWYYKFPITPSIQDLSAFLQKQTDKEKYLKMDWEMGHEVQNWEVYQLLLAIPKSSIRCIPKQLRSVVQHRYFWYLHPAAFKLKTLYKRYYHDCFPVLPRLEDSILDNLNDLLLSK
jgi:5'-3' exonuclease